MLSMILRNVGWLAATVGLAWLGPVDCLAQPGYGGGGYGAASGFGYRFLVPDSSFSAPSTTAATRTGATGGAVQAPVSGTTTAQPTYGTPVYNPYLGWTYTLAPPNSTGSTTAQGIPGGGPNYGVWTNLPSAMAASAYALPGNYYQPSQASYLPYSPNLGSTPAGLGYPVTALTFQTPNGPVTVNQASTNVTGNEMLYRAGYVGHTAPTPYYSYGLYSTFGTNPATPVFGAPTPSITTPYGTYGNLINPTTGAPPMTSGTTTPGVSTGTP